MMSNMYREVPLWWWGAVLAICWIMALVCLYSLKSTLPWWGFLISTIMMSIFLLFFGAQYGITGFQYNIQPICQTLAGYMFPRRPLASKSSFLDLEWFFTDCDNLRYVLYLLYLQLYAAGPVTRTRSQAGSVCSLISKAHFHSTDHRVCGRRYLELGHDDFVSTRFLFGKTGSLM